MLMTRKEQTPVYVWLSNFHLDLLAEAFMGGVVHTNVAPIQRAKLVLQNPGEQSLHCGRKESQKSRVWLIVYFARSERKAFFRSGKAMAAASFTIFHLLPSVSLPEGRRTNRLWWERSFSNDRSFVHGDFD